MCQVVDVNMISPSMTHNPIGGWKSSCASADELVSNEDTRDHEATLDQDNVHGPIKPIPCTLLMNHCWVF